MVDLADAGRRLAGWDAGAATDLTIIRNRARRRTIRRRAAASGAIALAAAAVVVAVVVVPGRPVTKVHVGSPQPASFPAVPLPAAPVGWTRTSIGNIDLAAPSAMVTTYSAAGQHRMALCVTTHCSTSSAPTAAQPVIISPLAGRPQGRAQRIDGLQVFTSGQGQRETFDVPALGVTLDTFGMLGRQIAETMAPSPAIVIASATTAPATPADWRIVHYGGVTLSIPTTWPNVVLQALPTSGQQPTSNACGLFPAPEIYLGDPPGECSTTASNHNSPGLWLGKSALSTTSDLTKTRLRWITGANVEFTWAPYGLSYLAQVTIHTPDGPLQGTVGLGSDPMIIEQVLASIQVNH